MNRNTTSERLKEIIEEKSLRQVDILSRAKPYCEKYGIKLTKSDLSQYISGKVEPNQKKLFILALALDVQESWLMGLNVPKSRNSKNAGAEYGELIKKFSALPDKVQRTVMNIIDDLYNTYSNDNSSGNE